MKNIVEDKLILWLPQWEIFDPEWIFCMHNNVLGNKTRGYVNIFTRGEIQSVSKIPLTEWLHHKVTIPGMPNIVVCVYAHTYININIFGWYLNATASLKKMFEDLISPSYIVSKIWNLKEWK